MPGQQPLDGDAVHRLAQARVQGLLDLLHPHALPAGGPFRKRRQESRFLRQGQGAVTSPSFAGPRDGGHAPAPIARQHAMHGHRRDASLPGDLRGVTWGHQRQPDDVPVPSSPGTGFCSHPLLDHFCRDMLGRSRDTRAHRLTLLSFVDGTPFCSSLAHGL